MLEFLAWSATYLDEYLPLTGLTRVITPSQLEMLAVSSDSFDLSKKEDAWVGGILGETLCGAGPEGVRAVSLRACMDTCLFAVGRAHCLGYFSHPMNKADLLSERVNVVSTRWQQLQKVGSTHQRAGGSSVESVARILVALSYPQVSLEASKPDERVVLDACREVLRDKGIRTSTFHKLLHSAGVPGSLDVRPFMAATTREEKFTLYEVIMASLREFGSSGDLVASFLAGYLLSRVAPGSLEHVEAIHAYPAMMPGALVFYGVCAGLDNELALQSRMGSLGRRVMRELTFEEILFQRPRCDLAFEELIVLLNAPKPWKILQGANPGVLTVEMAPGIVTTIEWPAMGFGSEQSNRGRDGGRRQAHQTEYPQLKLFGHDQNDHDERSLEQIAMQLHAIADELELQGERNSGRKNRKGVLRKR
ncbi:hypothetical protein [Chondromyces crocatus]|uniref:hypothetical protein n=1 Tax=Chondromyces crocatus TaxID=52 RepID=UPI0012E11D13|nr:hypothetical protein [Chondromyces crocatus]